MICSTAAGRAALVSWAGAASSAPSFALDPITADASGRHARLPAVDAADATTLTPGTDGFSARQVGALGYLLQRHGDATGALAGDVAAAVTAQRGNSAVATQCLDAGTDGLSAARSVDLWNEAVRLAGPYTVRLDRSVGKLILGQAADVTATVTSASGTPVPGIRVAFYSSEASASTGAASAVTDAAGRAVTTLSVASGSSTRAVSLHAEATVPAAPLVMSSAGEVDLVAAGPTRTVARSMHVPVDTTADPVVSASTDRSLVLPGSSVHPAIAVQGLRGHSGTATVSVAGPFALSPTTGCRSAGPGAGAAAPAPAAAAATVPAVTVTGDRTVPTRPVRLDRPGCYRLTPSITTSDATPNLHRAGRAITVAVAPVSVSVVPAGHGVTTGDARATVQLTASVPSRLSGVTATLLGPRMSDNGSCAAVDLPGTGTPLTARAAGTNVVLSAPSSVREGCYGYRVSGTVQIARLGSVPISSAPGPRVTTLVIHPSVSVAGLRQSSVVAGGHVSAMVQVSGTYTQPGAVRLRLLHLPYDSSGCFGRDWSHAAEAPSAPAPQTTTAGDGSYLVQSPAVPGYGCWTVVPELTLRANPAVLVSDAAAQTSVTDSMTAFTAVAAEPRTVPARVQFAGASGGYAGLIVAGVAMLGALIVAVGSTLSMALRDR